MGRKKGKLSKGQPIGARSASGRKRDRVTERVGPCDGVIRRQQLYRVPLNDNAHNDNPDKGAFYTDTCDALGRAYCAGLLGDGERAKSLLLAGRKIARQYWVHYQDEPDTNPLARFFPCEPGKPMSAEERVAADRILEDALNIALRIVDGLGRDVRRAFDHLVIDMNPDSGPAWLDRIVVAHRSHRVASRADLNMLSLALRGLTEVA